MVHTTIRDGRKSVPAPSDDETKKPKDRRCRVPAPRDDSNMGTKPKTSQTNHAVVACLVGRCDHRERRQPEGRAASERRGGNEVMGDGSHATARGGGQVVDIVVVAVTIVTAIVVVAWRIAASVFQTMVGKQRQKTKPVARRAEEHDEPDVVLPLS